MWSLLRLRRIRNKKHYGACCTSPLVVTLSEAKGLATGTGWKYEILHYVQNDMLCCFFYESGISVHVAINNISEDL